MKTVTFKLEQPIPPTVFTEVCYKLHFSSANIVRFRIDPSDRQTVTLVASGSVEDTIKKFKQVAKGAIVGTATSTKAGMPIHQFGTKQCGPNPHDELINTDQLIPVSEGLYGLGEPLVHDIARLDTELLRIADLMNARRHYYPPVLPVSVIKKAGFIDAFPQNLFFVSHIMNDVDAMHEFNSSVEIHDGQISGVSRCFAPTSTILQPAVCLHTYAHLSDRTIQTPLSITCCGTCFRYEAGNAYGLERLWSFNMREIVVFGSRDYVLKAREFCADKTLHLARSLGLSGTIIRSDDPFFMRTDYCDQSHYGIGNEDIKWELRVDLPYREGSTAAASFNIHGTFFSDRFNIKSADLLWTGCFAFGHERFALAISSYRESQDTEGR